MRPPDPSLLGPMTLAKSPLSRHHKRPMTSRRLLAAALLACAAARAEAITPRAVGVGTDKTAAPAVAPANDTLPQDWTGLEFPDNGHTRHLLFKWSQARTVSAGGFTQQFVLYQAEAANGQVNAAPTALRLQLNVKSGEARILQQGKELARFGNLGGVTKNVATMFSLPASPEPKVNVAGVVPAGPAPAAAAAGELSAFEKAALNAFPEKERQACAAKAAECRDKLADALKSYMAHNGGDKAKDGELTQEFEVPYLKARLGDQYAKLEEKLKAKTVTPQQVRQAMFDEMKPYVEQKSGSYDPDKTKVSVESLVAEPAGAAEMRPETKKAIETEFGDALYKQYLRQYGAEKFAPMEREYDMVFAYFKDKPEAAAMAKKLEEDEKAGKVDSLKQYQEQARKAAREQILTPASPSPFGQNKKDDLLDAFCDALATQEGALPASAASCQAQPAAAPADGKDKLAKAKATLGAYAKDPGAAGAAFDGARCPASVAPDPKQAEIDKQCAPWLDQHKKTAATAAARKRGHEGGDGLGNGPGDFTSVPDAQGSGDCPKDSPHCKDAGKPDANANIPWEIAAVWGGLALLVGGILTGGIGFAVIAGAAAATAVGYYLGQQANR